MLKERTARINQSPKNRSNASNQIWRHNREKVKFHCRGDAYSERYSIAGPLFPIIWSPAHFHTSLWKYRMTVYRVKLNAFLLGVQYIKFLYIFVFFEHCLCNKRSFSIRMMLLNVCVFVCLFVWCLFFTFFYLGTDELSLTALCHCRGMWRQARWGRTRPLPFVITKHLRHCQRTRCVRACTWVTVRACVFAHPLRSPKGSRDMQTKLNNQTIKSTFLNYHIQTHSCPWHAHILA